MYYSYAMGIGNEISNLENKGFIIEQFGNNYGITFPSEKANEWESFIVKNLELGYWNEYLADDKVIFLFQMEDGLKRYEVKDFQNEEVLAICEKLCERKFESIRDMLEENHFYRIWLFRCSYISK